MKDLLQSILGFALMIVILCAIGALIALFIFGSEWVAVHILPPLNVVVFFAAPICLFIFIPLGFVRRARAFAGYAMYLSSYLFGLTLWLTGLLVTLQLWGTVAVVIGLVLAGIGVVPIAFLASIFKGEWLALANLALLTVFTFGLRRIGLFRIVRAAEEAEAVSAGMTATSP